MTYAKHSFLDFCRGYFFNVDMGITPKQQKVYNYIIEFQKQNGFSPSQREIANNFGFKSLGTVQNYIKRLEGNQLLRKSWNSKRGIELLNVQTSNDDLLKIPMLGKVAAGAPIDFKLEEEIEVPRSYLRSPPETIFALEIEGDSMIGEGIFDGDIVFIKKQDHAKTGDTVVASLHGEATIKRFVRMEGHIELHSANTKYKPILVRPSDELRIEGLLDSLFRQY